MRYFLALLLSVTVARAEVIIVEQTPEAHGHVTFGQIIGEQPQVKMTFNKAIKEATVEVIDSEDRIVSFIPSVTGAVVIVPLKAHRRSGFVPGEHRVSWGVTAEDGESANGTFHFHTLGHGHN